MSHHDDVEEPQVIHIGLGKATAGFLARHLFRLPNDRVAIVKRRCSEWGEGEQTPEVVEIDGDRWTVVDMSPKLEQNREEGPKRSVWYGSLAEALDMVGDLNVMFTTSVGVNGFPAAPILAFENFMLYDDSSYDPQCFHAIIDRMCIALSCTCFEDEHRRRGLRVETVTEPYRGHMTLPASAPRIRGTHTPLDRAVSASPGAGFQHAWFLPS